MSVLAGRVKRKRERVKSQALSHPRTVFTVKDKDAVHAVLDRVKAELVCKEKNRKDNLLVGANECIKSLEKEGAISLVIISMARKKKSNLSFNELLGHVECICSETGECLCGMFSHLSPNLELKDICGCVGTPVIQLGVSRKSLGQTVRVKTASVIGIRCDSSLTEFLLSLATPSFHSTHQHSEKIPTEQ